MLEVGKEQAIKTLEATHRAYENIEAAAWAEPDMHAQARRLQALCLKQDETLIALRNMSEDDMRKRSKPDKREGRNASLTMSGGSLLTTGAKPTSAHHRSDRAGEEAHV